MTDYVFQQVDVDRIFTELGQLRLELDEDPLAFGPKRLNQKTATVRQMLDRCEQLFLDVSHRLQLTSRALRAAETELKIRKDHLMTNDPETRSGRSVSDREAIAAGKLSAEGQKVHELTLASEDLNAVLVVIKAKRADLRDTEGRLRDQIRLCSQELGLGGHWGTQIPGASEFQGTPATSADIADVDRLLQGLDQEVQLARNEGNWPEEPIGYDTVPDQVLMPGSRCSVCSEMQFQTPHGHTCKNGHGGAPSKEEDIPPLSGTAVFVSPIQAQLPEAPTTMPETHMALPEATTTQVQVDSFFDHAATVIVRDMTQAYAATRKVDSSVVMDVDIESILEMFEKP